jgi:hypothetical protein
MADAGCSTVIAQRKRAIGDHPSNSVGKQQSATDPEPPIAALGQPSQPLPALVVAADGDLGPEPIEQGG